MGSINITFKLKATKENSLYSNIYNIS